MADSHNSKAVGNFVDIGFAFVSRLGELRDQEGFPTVKDNLRSWQLQLQTAEDLLQDEVAAQSFEAPALRASLSVVRDLKVRLEIYFTAVSRVSQAGEFQRVLNDVWPSNNLEELGQRLSMIRALLR
jgi:hypothetical protein